jgi:hypothetical protein
MRAEWYVPCKTPLAVLKGIARNGRMPCPSRLSATTAFVLWTRRGVGLPGDRQGAMLAIDVDAVATRLQYPRVSYTDLDNLICKKSEEEVRSEAEGGEHSEEACASTCPK